MINMWVFIVTYYKTDICIKTQSRCLYYGEFNSHTSPLPPAGWLVLNINHPNKTALQKRSTTLKSGYGGSKKKQGKRMPDL